MNNNDVFKKLRVALQLRDDEIIEVLKLVDFKISKSELGAFFRKEDHPNFMECGDQVLRNFLNGLVIHLRGTKENPKNPGEVLLNRTSLKKEAVKPVYKAIQRKKMDSDISRVNYKNKQKSWPWEWSGQDFFCRMTLRFGNSHWYGIGTAFTILGQIYLFVVQPTFYKTF